MATIDGVLERSNDDDACLYLNDPIDEQRRTSSGPALGNFDEHESSSVGPPGGSSLGPPTMDGSGASTTTWPSTSMQQVAFLALIADRSDAPMRDGPSFPVPDARTEDGSSSSFVFDPTLASRPPVPARPQKIPSEDGRSNGCARHDNVPS